jgi:hypothetical protein
MIFRNLDASGDWTFGAGLSNYAQDERAVELNIQTRLLSWVGNCFFSLQDGIDWKARLDKGQQQALVNELKANILGAFGVVRVDSVVAILDARRRLMVTYIIDTIFSSSFSRTVAIASGVGS